MLQKRKKQETSICSRTIQKVFIENDGNRQYARNLYNNLFEEKKGKRREYAREKYRHLSEEEKDKKRQYSRERHRILFKKL